jgi:hypothetical protein
VARDRLLRRRIWRLYCMYFLLRTRGISLHSQENDLFACTKRMRVDSQGEGNSLMDFCQYSFVAERILKVLVISARAVFDLTSIQRR